MTRAVPGSAGAGEDVGVEGNARLTSVSGTLLLVLLAAEGVTILSIRRFISWHVYLGVLLVGPVVLKCASTGYRFVRYYRGAPPYVRKGPPHPVLRMLGPLVIVSSVAVLGTGIGLIYTGPAHRQPLLGLHKASFIVWFAAMALHVLGHVVDAGLVTWRELHDPPGSGARRWRVAAVAVSLIAGVGLASVLYPAAHAWTSGAGIEQSGDH